MNSAEQYGFSLSLCVEQAGAVMCINKQDVQIGDRLFIVTENSLYHVRVEADGWCDVSGGWFDRNGIAPLRTKVVGCSWGGSALMVDALAACGLCVEFGNRVVTSPVRRLILLRGRIEN